LPTTKVFKTRMQGNSVSISIAKDADVPVGREYSFEMDKDGRLIYTPVVEKKNPWHDGTLDGYDFEADVKQMGFNGGYESSVGAEGGQY